MKFLKQQNLSKFNISDNALIVNDFGRATINATGGLLLPKGTTIQRRQVHGVPHPTNAYGTIRYNTDLNAIEAYIYNDDAGNPDGVWETVKSSSRTAIHKQTLGPSDGVETVFGILLEQPTSDDNIIVLVENVMQISGTNFNVVYSDGIASIGPSGVYDEGWYVKFISPPPAANPGSLDLVYITIYYGYSN